MEKQKYKSLIKRQWFSLGIDPISCLEELLKEMKALEITHYDIDPDDCEIIFYKEEIETDEQFQKRLEETKRREECNERSDYARYLFLKGKFESNNPKENEKV